MRAKVFGTDEVNLEAFLNGLGEAALTDGMSGNTSYTSNWTSVRVEIFVDELLDEKVWGPSDAWAAGKISSLGSMWWNSAWT